MRADYSENAFQFLFGPSISIKISKNSAIGFTLYGFNDRRRRNIYGEVSVKDGTYGIVSINDNRVTNGMEPIFGIQTQLLNNMSLGLSVKKKFATDKNRRYSSRSILEKTISSSKPLILRVRSLPEETWFAPMILFLNPMRLAEIRTLQEVYRNR